MSDYELGSDENLSLEQIEAWMSQLAQRPPAAPVVQPPTKLLQVQGEVIKINKPLLFFDVLTKQRCVRIYIPFYSKIGKLVIFPRIGDSVKIAKIKHFKEFYHAEKIIINNQEKTIHRSTCVIHQEAVFEIESQNEIDKCDNRFLSFLNAHEISQDELIAINENIVRIVECFIYSGDDILLLIRAIYIELVCAAPSRKHFRVQLRLPIHLKYSNTKYDKVYSSLDFHPPSAFNVYHNRINLKIMTSPTRYETVTEFLVGTLVVQSTTGRFILKAHSSYIVVKFLDTSESLESINNALLLIKKYIVIIEIFTIPNYLPIIYVVVNPKDVVIVKPYFEPSFRIEKKLLFKIEEALPNSFVYKHQLEITKKSDVIIGYKGNKEVWMEGVIESYCTPDARKLLPFSSAKNHKTYIIITGELIKLAPILKLRQTYFFFTNMPLKMTCTPNEFKELKPLGIFYIIYVPSDALFQETRTEPQVFEHINENVSVSQLMSVMQANPSKTISFTTYISKKNYALQSSNFKSYYPKRHSEMFFGDIGDYQQRLTFYDEETTQYIDLYLNNRDNLAFPLGLVRDMKVRVNHVTVNRGKYLKSTPLTSIDVLRYHPRNKYSCANLAVTGDGKWDFRTTPPSLFGSDYHLPPNTIIHGLIIFRAIYDLNIAIICANCKHLNYQVNGCQRCKSPELDAVTLIIFNAEDGSAQQHFRMQTNSLDFLLEILTINQEKKTMFLRALQRYGPIKFNLLQVPLDFQEPKSTIIETMIRKLRQDINFNRPVMLNIVAMKQPSSKDCPLKPWLILDSHFVVPTNEVMTTARQSSFVLHGLCSGDFRDLAMLYGKPKSIVTIICALEKLYIQLAGLVIGFIWYCIIGIRQMRKIRRQKERLAAHRQTAIEQEPGTTDDEKHDIDNAVLNNANYSLYICINKQMRLLYVTQIEVTLIKFNLLMS